MNNICLYCKHFAIKIMMNGYHGVCCNENQIKFYHKFFEICDYFEPSESVEQNGERREDE